MSYAHTVLANMKRWTIKSFRNPFVLVFSLAQPIIFLILFTQVFGSVATQAIPGITYETYLVPAIIIQVSLAAAATSGIGFVNDIEEGIYEKTVVSPMRQSAVFIGKTAAELVRIATQIAIIIGLGVILGANVSTGIAGAIGMTLIGMLFSLWFIALTNTVAVVTEDQESTIIASNFVQFPLLFLSSAFLPLSELPGWIQTIAQYNPVTYGVNAVRSLILGESSGSTWTIQSLGPTTEIVVPGVIVLSALVLALGLIAVTTLKRSRNNLTK